MQMLLKATSMYIYKAQEGSVIDMLPIIIALIPSPSIAF